MKLLLWLLQALVTGIALAAMGTRVVRLPAPEAHQPPQPSLSYQQLRHLIVATVFLVLALWVALWLVTRTAGVLTLLAISILLAVALRPTVDRLSNTWIPVIHRRLPRALAILLIYLAIAVIAVGIGLLAVPMIINELQGLIANVPEYAAQIDQIVQGLQEYPWVPDLAALQQQLVTQLLGSLSQAVSLLLFAVNLLGGLLSVGLVLVLTFFLIMDADDIYRHLISLLPPSQRENTMAMTARMGRKIEGWLKGTLLLSLFIGAAVAVGMSLLGMPYPLLLGLAAGLFEFVPMVGAYLGAAPSVAVALFQPTWKLIAVVVFFIAIQQFENNILAPTVMGREVELPPLLVILALLFGAALKGILGALLAVPVAAVIQVVWTDLVVPEIRRRTQSPG